MTSASASQFYDYLLCSGASLAWCLKCERASRRGGLVGAFSIIKQLQTSRRFVCSSTDDPPPALVPHFLSAGTKLENLAAQSASGLGGPQHGHRGELQKCEQVNNCSSSLLLIFCSAVIK